jgi:hypothetical protein
METLEALYFSPNRGHWSRNTHVTILYIRYIYRPMVVRRWGGRGGILPLQLSHLWLHTALWPRLGLPTYLFMFTSTSPPCSFLHEKGKVLLQILRDYRVELRPGRPAGRQSLLLYSLAAIKLAIKLI